MCTSILSLTVFDSTEYHILLSVHLLASLHVEYLQVVSNSHMLTILNVIHVRQILYFFSLILTHSIIQLFVIIIIFSLPEPKAQVSLSDQNLSFVFCRRCKLFTFLSYSSKPLGGIFCRQWRTNFVQIMIPGSRLGPQQEIEFLFRNIHI